MILQLCRKFAQYKLVVCKCGGACRFALLAAVAGAYVLYSIPTYAQATFTPLGLFGGVRSEASDISADGSVIVGTTLSGSPPMVSVFRLTPQGATIRPTGLTLSAFDREPSLSSDGSTVVGTYLSPRGEEAFRCVGDGAFEPLGDLPGGDFQSRAYGVSADGSVVVGTSQPDSEPTAFRWTAAGGMQPLGTSERSARAVSADGSVVVGGTRSIEGEPGAAYRWTAQSGSIVLPPLPQPRFAHAEARAVTPDGEVVVGYNDFRIGLGGIHEEAFRWTEQEGTVSLRSGLWGFTVPFDVSEDGSVVVGRGHDPETTSGAAFIWTAETGMLSLRDALIFGGANMDGWTPFTATGISADGRTVVGTANGPNGQEAFVATLGAIPEPSTLALAALAAVALCAIRRRKWRSDQNTGKALALRSIPD
jgi:probable HAF family extracellular repeat protein